MLEYLLNAFWVVSIILALLLTFLSSFMLVVFLCQAAGFVADTIPFVMTAEMFPQKQKYILRAGRQRIPATECCREGERSSGQGQDFQLLMRLLVSAPPREDELTQREQGHRRSNANLERDNLGFRCLLVSEPAKP